MFYFINSINNIRRNKVQSIICILISSIMVFLLNIYIGNIFSIKEQLNELAKVMPIYCYITNLNGTQKIGLEIKENNYHGLLHSQHVKGMKSKLSMMAGVGEFPLEEYKENLNISLMAINHISAFQENTSELLVMGNGKDIAFLEENVMSCMVSEQLMEQRGWNIGDTIVLNIYYYEHDKYNMLKIKPLDIQEYEIVGKMKGTLSDSMEEAQIILPLKSVQEIYNRRSVPFSVDSLSFYVADPLMLNEFKEEMKAIGLLSVIQAADFSTDGNALNVRDATFISSATELREEDGLLKSFLPMIFLMIILVGYITSTLMIQNRKKEFRLKRIIGLAKGKVIGIFFFEQFLLVLVGITTGIVITQVFKLLQVSVFIIAGSLCLSYCLGSLVALIGLSRNNVMENSL